LIFKKKKYLITGASSGLGRQLSYYLDNSGATLTILGSNNKELSKTFNNLSKNKKHKKIIADFSNLKKSKVVIKNIFRGSKYDGFINCAGIHSFSPINGLSDEQIIESFNINSIYPYLILKNFTKTDNYNTDASIVLIGTISSITGSSYLSLYSSSKISQINLSKSLSTELSKKKIRINTISAGMLESKIWDGLKTKLPKEYISEIEKKHPLGIGKYEDVINSISFFLSNNSKWITGTNFIIDGGFSAS
tara:strand:+ start:388 stop:1134 length:747 start_codon:yes stop_codon:yes gene_type:complete